MDDITIVMTDGLDGGEATEYVDVVSGEAIIGVNAIGDIAAGVRDIVDGQSGSSETKIEAGRDAAVRGDRLADGEHAGRRRRPRQAFLTHPRW